MTFGIVDLICIVALVLAWMIVKPILKITAKVIFVIVCFVAGFVLAAIGKL